MIYLVRHGEIEKGEEKRFIGQVEVPLSIKGHLQAVYLGDEFKKYDFKHIFCSDISRCVKTAEIIAHKQDKEITVLNELREINLGKWDGKTFKEIKEKYPKEFNERGENFTSFCPPEGESFEDLSKRILPVFKDITEKAMGDILIVSHAGVNRVILCDLLGIPLDDIFSVHQDYGCINLIEKNKDKFRVNIINNESYQN